MGRWADGQILATLISKSKEPARYKLLDQVLSTEPIANMLPKDDAAFKRLVDQSIVPLAKSGEAARIDDKWFLKPIPPQDACRGKAVTAFVGPIRRSWTCDT